VAGSGEVGVAYAEVGFGPVGGGDVHPAGDDVPEVGGLAAPRPISARRSPGARLRCRDHGAEAEGYFSVSGVSDEMRVSFCGLRT
jgi:hypothetical protein